MCKAFSCLFDFSSFFIIARGVYFQFIVNLSQQFLLLLEREREDVCGGRGRGKQSIPASFLLPYQTSFSTSIPCIYSVFYSYIKYCARLSFKSVRNECTQAVCRSVFLLLLKDKEETRRRILLATVLIKSLQKPSH